MPELDLQTTLATLSDVMESSRRNYHLSLGQLIDVLKTSNVSDGGEVFVEDIDNQKRYGLGDPDSYRGYYEDLAFDPTFVELGYSVRELLSVCKDSLGKTFEGYKGGDFTMSASTSLWLCEYGTTGGSLALLSATERGGQLVLFAKSV